MMYVLDAHCVTQHVGTNWRQHKNETTNVALLGREKYVSGSCTDADESKGRQSTIKREKERERLCAVCHVEEHVCIYLVCSGNEATLETRGHRR